ncbi:MAG TPA: hypothetical protein VKF80_00025 [Candidatus Eisenbacteria bacterium]|nr:hypothetical protein [Candidatus Eisenbacteria bacterium]
MIPTLTEPKRNATDSLLAAQVDAQTAFDAAARASSQACEWSSRAGLSGEDAAEAIAAAERARHELEASCAAQTEEAAWAAARAAWAAASSAMEALERVSAEITKDMMAA